MNAGGPTATLKIDRKPTAIPKAQSEATVFTTGTGVIFQFLPSGSCLPLTVELPKLLGRPDDSLPESQHPLVDLTPYNAQQHGVSRRHCLIQQADNRLTLMDLGSTNGTYLNGEQMVAFSVYTLADSDKLILGTLHLMICFTPAEADR